MPESAVEFGYVVPDRPPKGDLGRWQTQLDTLIPALGHHFKSLWMTDHFFWDDDPTYEAWTVITYLAMRYPQFKVGSVVMGQSYRNPALLAKMTTTLQALSSGRFILGIGAGWKEDEYLAYGYPFPKPLVRVEQLEDTLEILTRLWRESGAVSYDGKHYHIHEAYCEPKPDPMIPLIVGGGGRKTMMLAARFADEWNMPDCHIDVYASRLEILKQHCQTINRDLDSLSISWFGRLSVADTYEEAVARSDGRWTHDNAIVGTLDDVKAQLQAFVDLGVSRFMLTILDIDDPSIQAHLFDDLLPQFQ